MRESGPASEDRRWMEQALALGALAEGTTCPNPRVGCLLVRDGRPVGWGYHRAPGLPHAEALAVARAGPAARGATVYVNLEPCAHDGRTPPCADLLVRSGVSRVVAAVQDPNPRVDGRGLATLRRAGIRVEVGLLASEALRLNEPFIRFHRHGLPQVTIKAAISLDGMIAAQHGRSKWISGEPARRFAHRLRLRHDAVLVGAETVRRDDPQLTAGLPGDPGTPLRVVLSADLRIDPEARLFRVGAGPLPRIYVGRDTPVERAAPFAGRAEVVRVDAPGGRLGLRGVLEDLARLDVQSVLVEGGARTLAGFLEAGLAQRAMLFVTSELIGARGGTPLLDLPSAAEPGLGWRLEQVGQLALGGDCLLLGRLRPPAVA